MREKQIFIILNNNSHCISGYLQISPDSFVPHIRHTQPKEARGVVLGLTAVNVRGHEVIGEGVEVRGHGSQNVALQLAAECVSFPELERIWKHF